MPCLYGFVSPSYFIANRLIRQRSWPVGGLVLIRYELFLDWEMRGTAFAHCNLTKIFNDAGEIQPVGET